MCVQVPSTWCCCCCACGEGTSLRADCWVCARVCGGMHASGFQRTSEPGARALVRLDGSFKAAGCECKAETDVELDVAASAHQLPLLLLLREVIVAVLFDDRQVGLGYLADRSRHTRPSALDRQQDCL